jgi:hypothetical protein
MEESLMYMVCAMVIVALFVLEGLGMHTISRRRGLPHGWMSWVPLLRIFQLGTISDDYRLRQKGRRGIHRWLLLVTASLYLVGIVLILGACFYALVSIFPAILTLGLVLLSDEYMNAAGQMQEVAEMMGLCGSLMILPYSVMRPVAGYRVYRSCRKGLAVVFLLLSMLVPPLHGLFLYFLRNDDSWAQPAP